MFIGHFGVGFGSKPAAPQVSLGTLIFSVQFLDLIWPIFVLAGLEHFRVNPGDTAFTPLDFYDYPYSHSLAAALFWSVLFGLTYYAVRRYLTGSLVLAAGVFSHWVLDFISHRADLPLAPGSHTYFGLGLWNNVPASVIVEGLIFIAGVALYAWYTQPMDRVGTWAFWGMVILLAVLWIGNIAGPPPPDGKAVAAVGLLVWLFVPWGYWIGRHRRPRRTHQTTLA